MSLDRAVVRGHLVGLSLSLALHALVIIAARAVELPDSGFEFTLPSSIELGLAEATEAALPAAAPSQEEEPAGAGAGSSGSGAQLDGGVPLPDGGAGDGGVRRRRRRDAGADGGEAIGVASASDGPVAFLPAGAQIALRVDMDRVRASPLADDVRHLLGLVPEWEMMLSGSEVRPVDDLSRVLVATPNFQRASMVVAGALADGAPDAESVVARMSAAHGQALEWSDEAGVPSASWPALDGAPRRVAVLDPRHFVVSRPDDLPRVLAIAAARTNAGEPSAAEALLAMREREALSVEVEGVAHFIRRTPCPATPTRVRASLVEDEAGVRVDAEAVFEDAEGADGSRGCLEALRDRYLGIARLFGFGSALEEATLALDGAQLRAQTTLSIDQLSRLLAMATGALVEQRRRTEEAARRAATPEVSPEPPPSPEPTAEPAQSP